MAKFGNDPSETSMMSDPVPEGTSVVQVLKPVLPDNPVSVLPNGISFSPIVTYTGSESAAEAVSPALTVLIEKLAVSVAVGVPEIVPAEDRLRPVGRLPLAKNQL